MTTKHHIQTHQMSRYIHDNWPWSFIINKASRKTNSRLAL